ncbi:hypothetical protein [Thermococcus sp.]
MALISEGFEKRNVRNPFANKAVEKTPKVPRALAKARAHRG